MRNLFLIFNISVLSLGYGQSQEWFALPVQVNGWVETLVDHQGKLIAGGSFTMAGTDQMKSISAWDGSTWSSLGGITLDGGIGYVIDMISVNDSLIVVGNFDSAGSINAVDIAVWDGANWTSMGSGTNGVVKAIEIYNNELYVAGWFDTIDGIQARGIAKWNGTSWSNLGSGLRYNTYNEDVYELCIYDNLLFASGNIDSAGNVACENIAYWDGADWGTIPSPMLNPSSSMIVWNNELLIYSGGGDTGLGAEAYVHSWDGSNYALFSSGDMYVFAFGIFGGELYAGGGDGSYNYGNVVRKWNGTDWEFMGTGINDAVDVLCEYSGDLYAGGTFSSSTGSSFNFVARFAELNSVNEHQPLLYKASVYPNPSNGFATIYVNLFQDATIQIDLMDLQGQTVQRIPESQYRNGYQEISMDISNVNAGIYLVKVNVNGNSRIEKLILE